MDTSSLVAASASPPGASRSVFRYAAANGWRLLTSPYALGETERNIARFPAPIQSEWRSLRPALHLVGDVWVHDRPVVFDVPKDRPILFTAAAHADVLLTLDRRDFHARLGGHFYNLAIRTPAEFLESKDRAGDLIRLQP